MTTTTYTQVIGPERGALTLRVRRFFAEEQADGTWTLEDHAGGPALRVGMTSAEARQVVKEVNQ